MQILEARRVDKKQTLQENKALAEQNRNEAIVIWNSRVVPSYSIQQTVVEINGVLWLGPEEATVTSQGIAIPSKLGHLDPVYRYSQVGQACSNDR
jgi:hypothetical protein